MKIHCGSGTVYLRDWCNVDLPTPKTFLAEERPDLVEKYITDEHDYYRRHKAKTVNSFRAGPITTEYIADRFGSFFNLPARDGDADEFLARQSFEHISLTEAHRALTEINRVLRDGGVLRLDVPDHEETLEKLRSTQDSFYARHLMGPRSSEYGYHMLSYCRDTMKNLVQEHGFIFMLEESSPHLYPAFTLRFIKNG